MTNEEAVHDLIAIKEFFEQTSEAFPVCLEHAIEVIEGASEEREWVPCSEGLPDKKRMVSVSASL